MGYNRAHAPLCTEAADAAECVPYRLASVYVPADEYAMEYEADAFISYAHLDNVALIQGGQGWITSFQRDLAVRVAQMLGKESRIWWDKKLTGDDVLDDTLMARLQRVAVLVSVVTPRYVRSEWCRREVEAFCTACLESGGLQIGEKLRLFKVHKTQVPLEEHPPQLQRVLGYDFFKIDADTGKTRELNDAFGPDSHREYWLKLDDLAQDMCALLRKLEREARQLEAPAPRKGAVYLAVTTSDLIDQCEVIKRELNQQGYTVLPDRPLPLAQSELEAAIREHLAACRLSIHLVGRSYGVIPEDGTLSLCEIQHEMAIERCGSGDCSRLIWIPPGLKVQDERQRQYVERLRNEPRLLRNADVVEKPLEELRTLLTLRLREDERAAGTAAAPAAAPEHPYVYLIHDARDAAVVPTWCDFLFQHFEVIRSVFDGDEAETRAYHEENLRIADGVVILYGAGSEVWLSRKLREIRKSAGYGRTKARADVAICLLPPRTPAKAEFRTHEATVVPQWDGVSVEAWQSFIARVKNRANRRPGHADDISA
jgi:hypothetical protein